jgi:hypothetical protein
MKLLEFKSGLLSMMLLMMVIGTEASDFDSVKGLKKSVLSNEVSLNNILVSSGQIQEYTSSSHLTLSGSDPVKVDANGSITLIAGKSIQLLPGTKVTVGGFMYASVLPHGKEAQRAKQKTRLVTIEENEKIEEEISLAGAAALISPFTTANKGELYSGSSSNGCIRPSVIVEACLGSEQSRNVVFSITDNYQIFKSTVILNSFGRCKNYFSHKECQYVLRL